MSDAHRHDIGHADDAPSTVDRDAKIEQLLLLGLDHYFAARYELAINVWTRALFIDRSHRGRTLHHRARTLAEASTRVEEHFRTASRPSTRRGGQARRLLRPPSTARHPRTLARSGTPESTRDGGVARTLTPDRLPKPAPRCRTPSLAVPRSGVRSSVWWRVTLLTGGAFAASRRGIDLRSVCYPVGLAHWRVRVAGNAGTDGGRTRVAGPSAPRP
jgi:hypothetical protein